MPDSMIEALAASGPHPPDAEGLQLFGQFVGAWDIEVTDVHPDGSRVHGRGEWLWGWILGGRAIQDVYVLREGPRREHGVTVRLYDPRHRHWRVCWVGPVAGSFRTFVARPNGDEIVLEGADDAGRPMRWVFSEITPDRYRWRAIVADQGSEGWRLAVEIRARRRRP